MRPILTVAFAALVAACANPGRSGQRARSAGDVAPTPPFTAAGTLVVLNKGSATASLVDLETGQIRATVPTGNGPHEVAVSADGLVAVVTNYGTGPQPGNSLTVIDLAAARAKATIDLGQYARPHGIAWLDSARVVVTSEASSAVVIVNVSRSIVERGVATGARTSHMVAVAPDGRRAYTANIADGSVSRIGLTIDGTANATSPTGAGAEGIDVTPSGREIWVTNREANTVTVLDANSLEIRDAIPSADFPIRVKITPDGRFALVTNARSSVLRIFDAGTHAALGEVAFGIDSAATQATMLGASFGGSAVPIGVLVVPGGRRAYVALAGRDRVAEVDLEGRRVIRLLVAGREPDGLGWTPIRVARTSSLNEAR